MKTCIEMAMSGAACRISQWGGAYFIKNYYTEWLASLGGYK